MTDLLLLYQISNNKDDSASPNYNACYIPHDGSSSVTLSYVKSEFGALNELGGPENFHFRVRMEDQNKSYSWWDVLDENAKLPVRSTTLGELEFLYSPEPTNPVEAAVSKTAKSAMKTFSKVISGGDISTTSSHSRSNPYASAPMRVLTFKLLDLGKLYQDFGTMPAAVPRVQPKPRRATPSPTPANTAPAPVTTTNSTRPTRVSTSAPAPRSSRTGPTPVLRKQPPKVEQDNLMDFGSTVSSTGTASATTLAEETRAERLKREYAQKAAKQNRVWDEVDQRWVDSNISSSSTPNLTPSTSMNRMSTSASVSSTQSTSKVVGISLDATNSVGKSVTVQAAVNKRVNDMKQAQAQALNELRERDRKAKAEDDAEDEVRKRLEPKVKAWSEEHGKKKQLRALLASLHVILWPEANWKSVSIGDILDDKKARRCYLKATLKVHPDKTKDLDAEKRFLAKRIFDALSQAMTDFEKQSK